MLAFSMGSKGKRDGVLIKNSPSCFYRINLFRNDRALNLRALASKHCNHFALLIADFHVVNSVSATQGLLLPNAGQDITQLA
jgi:hypothetical protein